ncbi:MULTISPECIES: hypothetical protein [Rhizobium]|nr:MULTISPECIES: hypothetical protein [Rhizobium]NKJ07433.1 hypothetical protein [Rhizobium sp. SG741]
MIRITAAGAAAQRAIVAVETADAEFFGPVDEAQLAGLLRQIAGEIR